MEAVAASNIETTVYFYNPNIHPIEEYEMRKDENKDSVMHWDSILLMLIMIKKSGLSELRVLRMNLKEGKGAQNASI